MERESRLRTKAMRERDEVKMMARYYRFTLIRVRFPEGLILQGKQLTVVMGIALNFTYR